MGREENDVMQTTFSGRALSYLKQIPSNLLPAIVLPHKSGYQCI